MTNIEIIKSISYNQDEIITNILKLHSPHGVVDVDPTYSKGYFYKNIPAPKFKFDILPQTKDTTQADCTNLPLENSSISCIMLDLPFVIGGKAYKEAKEGSCVISKRFESFTSNIQLENIYSASIQEAYRVLEKNGLLIFKCQDIIESGKRRLSHVFVINEGRRIGFYAKDIFILLAKNRIIGKMKTQQHSRSFHSYFICLVKI